MGSERPRGILSPADREYLRNPDSISRQAQYNRREAIVERTHEGICDLAMLKATLPQDLRENIISYEEDQDIPLSEQRTIYNRFSDALAFIFLLMADGSRANMSDTDIIERFVSGAVKSVFEERELMVEDVSVSIDVNVVGDLPTEDELENLTLDQAVEQIESDELTPEVLIGYLMQREAEEKIAKGEADEDSEFVALDKKKFEAGENHVLNYDLRQFSAFRESDDGEE